MAYREHDEKALQIAELNERVAALEAAPRQRRGFLVRFTDVMLFIEKYGADMFFALFGFSVFLVMVGGLIVGAVSLWRYLF